MLTKSPLYHLPPEKCIFCTFLGKLYHFAPEKSLEQAKMTSNYTLTQLFSRRKATFPSYFFSKSDVPSHWNFTLQLSHLAPEYAFDPQTTDYCWLKKETIDKLRKGETDDFIRMITDGYNSSSKTKFTLKFLIESEVVYWLEYRAREVGDKTSLNYITQYKKSMYGE